MSQKTAVLAAQSMVRMAELLVSIVRAAPVDVGLRSGEQILLSDVVCAVDRTRHALATGFSELKA